MVEVLAEAVNDFGFLRTLRSRLSSMEIVHGFHAAVTGCQRIQ